MMVTAEQLRDAQARLERARAASQERADRDGLIREALTEQWTPSQIARALGISQPAVWQIINGRNRRRGDAG